MTIEQNSTDVNLISYTNYGVENNDKDPKFKVGDHVSSVLCCSLR